MNAGVSSRGSPTPKSTGDRPARMASSIRRSSPSNGYASTACMPGEKLISLIALGERTAGLEADAAASPDRGGIGRAVADVRDVAPEQGPPVLETLDVERPPAEPDRGSGACAPRLVRRDRHRARAGAAREGLADA